MRDPTIHEILSATAETFNCSINDLLSHRRTRSIARPRQVACYLARTLTQKSMPEIARVIGGRDHTTIIHACRTIDKLRVENTSLQQAIDRITVMCGEDLVDKPEAKAHIIEAGEIAAGLRQLGRDAMKLANVIDGKTRASGNENS